MRGEAGKRSWSARFAFVRSAPAWTVVALGLVSGVIALVARANLFPLMSGDSDEPVYVYQARMLAQGHVTLASRAHAEFFHPWLFAPHGSRLYSQYQPGWPAVIAFAHLLGDERIALVIAAIAAVTATWFLARQVAPGSEVFAAVLLLVSPIFVVQAGLYLTYLWTAALVAGALGATVAAVRSKRRAPCVVSGALFGLAFLTRPFDAFIVAALATVYVVVSLRRERPALGRTTLYAALGVAPFLLVTLVYNAHITGSPLRFPLQAAEHLDTFGFGARHATDDSPTVHYTARVALTSLRRNTFSMPHWFAGGGIGLALAVGAVVVHRRRRETWLLVATVAVFPVTYFFWWATALSAPGAAKGLGPHYYIPAFVPLAVLAGWALRDLVRRSRAWGGVAIVAVIAGSLFMAPTVLRNAHTTTDLQRAKDQPFTSAALDNAVVIMRADPSPYSLINYPFLVGDPDLKGRVLYATDRGAASAELAQQFPTRKLYQLVQRAEPGDSILHPSYVIEPVTVERGPYVTLRFRATNTGGQPRVVASVTVNDRTVATQTLDRASRKGKTVTFAVALAGSDLPAPRPGLLTAQFTGDASVRVDVAFERPADATHADVYERRYDAGTVGVDAVVQRPGLQYHRFDFGHVVWVRENVEANLAEVP